MARLILVGWLMMSVVGGAQKPAVADPFERLAFLIGKWKGASDGQPGKGTVRREYAWALNTRFVRVLNRSEYPPQPKNPKGEIHEDEGFFSFDKVRQRVVFRQFHTEGFVNTYVEDAESSATKVVFTSEAIENIPAGFRARADSTVGWSLPRGQVAAVSRVPRHSFRAGPVALCEERTTASCIQHLC